MYQTIYEELKRVARMGKPTPYGKIAPLAGLDMSRADHRAQMSTILAEISTYEHENGRPLLSVVVIHTAGDGTDESDGPGIGFYTLAKELGVMKGNDRTRSSFQSSTAPARIGRLINPCGNGGHCD